ncbi:MAG: helix-turn-helix domain-containing protein [Clostridia bacterium]|nr:helix-turn-helix domain-containing protein [Clostridia bacterium]
MSNVSCGQIIRELRKNKKLSQNELGKLLGFSARTVSDWENGNTEPNIATIKALVHFFDITYEEFFDDN